MVRRASGPWGHALAFLTCLTVAGGAGPAAADAPDAFWNAPWVQVQGADANLAGAINNGLRLANQTYFYGDRATKMVATVRGDTVDVKIIDQATGKVLASQGGLAFSGTGDAATNSIRSAALAWMERLGCGSGCAVAGGGSDGGSGGGSDDTTKTARDAAGDRPKQPVRTARAPEPAAEKSAAAPAPDREDVRIARAPATAATTPDRPAPERDPVVEKSPKAPEIDRTPETPAPPKIGETGPAAGTPDIGEPKVAKPEVVEPKPVEPKVAELKPVKPRGETGAVEPKAAEPRVIEPRAAAPAIEPNTGSAAVAAAPALDKAPTAGSGDDTPAAPAADDRPVETPGVADTPAAPETPERVAATTEPLPGVRLSAPSAGTVTPRDEPKVGSDAPKAGAADTAPVGSAIEPEAPRTGAVAGTGTTAPDAAATTAEAGSGATLPAPRPGERTAGADDTRVAVAGTDSAATRTRPEDAADARLAAELDANLKKPETGAGGDSGGTADKPADKAGDKPADKTDDRLAAVDPTDSGPTLANARWIGFTPAVYKGSDNAAGAWISGPFDRKERTGWITDTATGATTRVKFVWREGGSDGRTAILSKAAAEALGLGQGDVANVAVYLPR